MTRDGEPLAELTPLRRPRFIPLDRVLTLFAGSGDLDLRDLRRDLDTFVDQNMEPRG